MHAFFINIFKFIYKIEKTNNKKETKQMVFIHKYYEQYNYHYQKVYPIELFIKNRKNKKLLKKQNYVNLNLKDSNGKKVISNDKYEKKKQSIRKYEILTINYYNSYKNNIFRNINIPVNNEIYEKIYSINKENNKIVISNAEIIYIYYNIYNEFLKYVKQNYIANIIECGDIKTIAFYKNILKCYGLINDLSNSIIDKNKIITLLSMLKINVNIISRLNELCTYKLKVFLKDKYNQNSIGDDNCKNIVCNNIEEKYKDSNIKNICKNILISYIGYKRKIANEIISSITLNNNRKINTYIELFGGSLCISYLIKTLYPRINIICYENDKFLMNFYFILKNKYDEFISRLSNIIDILYNSDDKFTYLEEIINITNKKLYNDYYIINKISFRGTLNYNEKRQIKITINKKRISMLLNFSEKHKNKLHNYSLFLNKIELINIDIEKNYNEILNNIDEKTVIYVDPPYYKDINNHKPYYNILKVRNDICNSIRKELLITSF